MATPNRSLDRQEYVFCSFSGCPSAFVLPAASCLPRRLDVARYDFDKGDSQSARRQNKITLDSNGRFGVKGLYRKATKPQPSPRGKRHERALGRQDADGRQKSRNARSASRLSVDDGLCGYRPDQEAVLVLSKLNSFQAS